MRRISFPLALIALLAACPHHHGAAGGDSKMPAAVATYPALRWVPAGVSAVVTAKSAADLTAFLRDFADLAGSMTGDSADNVSRSSNEAFGYDVLSPDSLAGIGIDPKQGFAFFATGLNPTIAIALGDPDKLTTFLDGEREKGISIQSQLDGKIEVFTVRDPDTGLRFSWAVVDGWLLAHVRFQRDDAPELQWLDDARAAAGGFAGTADFTAALAAAQGHDAVVGVIHPGPYADLGELFVGPACVAPLRAVPRVLLSASSGSEGLTVDAKIEGATSLQSLIVPAPGGWYAVRNGAPLQADLSLDLQASAKSMMKCQLVDLELLRFGARTAHLALQSFDGGFPSKGGAYADLIDSRAAKAMISQIPYVSHFSSSRKVGADDVVDVSIPMVPSFSYALSDKRIAVGIGDQVIETILGAGAAAPAGEVAHVDVHPNQIPDDAWDLLFDQMGMGGESRADTIARLHRWDEVRFDASLAGDAMDVTLVGTRHH